jgi:hypothetical protein
MTLRKRLAKLEAWRRITTEAPRVIVFNLCWRDDRGTLHSRPHRANVLTASGWQSATRQNDEPDAAFLARVDALASCAAPSPA